jgi:hypothetical protein
MLFANVAMAQTLTESERTSRVSLMVRAEQASVEGHLDEAIQLAIQAERIGATAGINYFLSRAYAQQARYVSSLERAQACLRSVDSDQATSVANRRALRVACEDLRAQSMNHVAMLTVRVLHVAPHNMVVRLNNDVLSPTLYNIEQAVPVGNVSVTVSMEGRPSQEQRQVVRAGTRYIIDVEIPTAPVEPVAQVSTENTRVSVNTENTVTTTPPSLPGRTQRTLAWVSGGAGLALVATGLIAGGMFLSVSSEYETLRCSQRDLVLECDDRYNKLETLNTVQWIGYVGGGALLVTGAVLMLTAPRASSRVPVLSLSVGQGSLGVSYSAAF